MARPGAQVNISVFVVESLQRIHDAVSRSRELQPLRDQCKALIDELRGEEFGQAGSRITVPFAPDLAQQLVAVFRAAFATSNPRLIEPALSCLHKLVAYAYLQGETSNSGRLDDTSNMVTQAVTLTAKCGESNFAAVQLSVVKALLTFVTAEHFLVHGDSLMQAVRTVFNMAIGSGSPEMQSTAQSALLQMLNTVLKRVGQQVGSPHYTPQPSPMQMFDLHWRASSEGEAAGRQAGLAPSGDHSAALGGSSGELAEGNAAGAAWVGPEEGRNGHQNPVTPAQQRAVGGPQSGGSGEDSSGGEGEGEGPGRVPSQAISAALATELSAPLSAVDMGASPGVPGSLSPLGEAGAPGAERSEGHAVHAEVEAADEERAALLPPGLPRIETKARASVDGGHVASPLGAGGPADDEARTAQLASLAEQADLRGLERAFDQTLPPPPPGGHGEGRASSSGAGEARSSSGSTGLARQETPPDPRRALMRDRRREAWKRLTVVERDAVIVLSAMCKMAARETGFGAMETYMHKGKLLALDLLLRVLSNPMHDWGHVRPLFAAELRQPLCVALLRNCMSPYDQALTAAVRIFGTVLAVPRLRAGMKAELGALYPLLLLRPIESERPDSAHQMQMALEGLLGVCSSAQVLVDVFINYDCSLQASNLFERTIKALTKVVQLQEGASPFPAPVALKMKQTALKAMLAAIKSLDTWAGPIKSAAAAAAEGGADAEAAGESTTSPHSPQRQLLERIAAAKEMKDALEGGIGLFNKNPVKGVRLLVETGILDGSAEGVADFLREHGGRLDKGMVGELFGDHDDFSIQVMHAYIDQERYGGITIDAALRKLLANFRLPGEAQKIDRIMEKFAERYCRDNPAAFACADAAYLLAFAIIMLNTDAHNPMADRRILAPDFVAMSTYQTEVGEFEPILRAEDLEAIYTRITEQEIKVGEDGLSAAGKGAAEKESNSRRAKLASAMGLPQMVLPFWSGATWDKQHGVDVERKRLLAITQEMVASGGMTGNLWHTASHAEHARPMLQVCGDSVLKSLAAALAAAPTLQAAAPVLDGYEQAIQLAALLRLEALCEALLSSLAAAASVDTPAPFQSQQEAKQVAALTKLVSLGSCAEAGMLGTSWVVLLRTLSHLERLQAALMPGTRPATPYGNGAMSGSFSSPDLAAPSLPPPPQPTSSFGRLLARMGLGSGGEAAEGGVKLIGGLPIREGPGAGFVLWAETAGAMPTERVYSSSAALPGDAVVTFMRALCAVSQEELNPAKPGERPRVHLLQKVVECAHHNMGRIRLVWARVWTVVAQHLVSAACHTDPYVAMYAVDALRQLAAKLLDRAELARFTHQGEALRPFAAILRHSDSPAVRELAAACVVQAITAHPRGLGSGWRSVIEALTVAAGDSAPGVVNQALDALQPVLEALYHPEGIGHAALRECVGAALAAAHNPHGFEDLSVGALYLFQTIARRLADAVSEGAGDEELLPLPSPSSAALRRLPSEQPGPWQGSPGPSPVRQPLPGAPVAPAGGEAGPAGLQPEPNGSMFAEARAGRAQLQDGVAVSGEGGAALPAWRLVLLPLAAAARLDVRPKVADTAAAVLFQLLKSHGHTFSPALWQALYAAAVAPVLALPGAASAAAAGAAGDVAAEESLVQLDSALALSREPSEAVSASGPAAGHHHHQQLLRRTTTGGSAAAAGLGPSSSSRLLLPPAAAALLLAAGGGAVGPGLSSEGLYRLERHASAHMPDLWALVVEHYGVAGPVLLPQALGLLRAYVAAPSETLAVLGANQLYHLAHRAGPVLDQRGWDAVVGCLEGACADCDPLGGLAGGPGGGAAAVAVAAAAGLAAAPAAGLRGAVRADSVRRRCRLQVLLQRVADQLLAHSAACMPGGSQLALLGLLRHTVASAEAFNGGYGGGGSSGGGAARAAAAGLLAAPAEGGAAQLAQRGSSSLGEEGSWEVVEPPEGHAHPAGVAPFGASMGQGPALLELGAGAGAAEAAAASGDALLPALVRQEVGGGCLLIGSLQRCADQPLTSDQSEPQVQAEAEAQLAAYCLEVVEAAALRIRQHSGNSCGGSGGGAGSGSGLAAPGAGVAAGGGAFSVAEALQPWEDTLRGPLEEAALHALASLGRDAWRRQQPRLFQQLSQLMCTPSRGVRQALAALMQRQLPAAFPELGLPPPRAQAPAAI